jgi:hypothetical protein
MNKIQDRINTGELTGESEIRLECDRVYDEAQSSIIRHREVYYNSINRRTALARSISRASPAALFQFACENISGSGPDREKAFLQAAQAFSRRYDSYIVSKVGKLVGVSDFSFGGSLELGGKSIGIQSPVPPEYQGDKSDFPVFTEGTQRVMSGFNHALPDVVGLILWNLALMLAAFGAILKTDVR